MGISNQDRKPLVAGGRAHYIKSLWKIEQSVREGRPVWRNPKVLRAGITERTNVLEWLQTATVTADMRSFVPDRPGLWSTSRAGAQGFIKATRSHAITAERTLTLRDERGVRHRQIYVRLWHRTGEAPPPAHVSTLAKVLESKGQPAPYDTSDVSRTAAGYWLSLIQLRRAMGAPRVGDALRSWTVTVARDYLFPLPVEAMYWVEREALPPSTAAAVKSLMVSYGAYLPTQGLRDNLIDIVADIAACRLLARFRVPDQLTMPPPRMLIRGSMPQIARAADWVAEQVWSEFTLEDREAIFTGGPRLATGRWPQTKQEDAEPLETLHNLPTYDDASGGFGESAPGTGSSDQRDALDTLGDLTFKVPVVVDAGFAGKPAGTGRLNHPIVVEHPSVMQHRSAEVALVAHLRSCLQDGRWPDLSTIPYSAAIEHAWVRARLRYERSAWVHLGAQTMLRRLFSYRPSHSRPGARPRYTNLYRGPDGRFISHPRSTLNKERSLLPKAKVVPGRLPGEPKRYFHLLPAAPGSPRSTYDLTRYWTPVALSEKAVLDALERRHANHGDWSVTRKMVLQASRWRHPSTNKTSSEHDERTLERRWEGLQSRLLTEDAYRQAAIPKASGGVRVIDIPSEPLKRVQSFLAKLVDRSFVMPRHVAAFHRHRSVGYHARTHAGARVAAILDVENFFGSIRPAHLAAVIGPDEAGFRPQGSPFRGWSAAGRRAVAALIFLERDGIQRLPQGAPTSPVFANLAALHMDALIVRDAQRAFGEGGFAYSRYADDLVLSITRTGKAPQEAARILGRRIREQGWRPNHKKARLWTANGARRLLVCGVLVPSEVTGRVDLPREQRLKLRLARHRVDASRKLNASPDPRDIGLTAWGFHVGADPRDMARIGCVTLSDLYKAVVDLALPVRARDGSRVMRTPDADDIRRVQEIFIRGT